MTARRVTDTAAPDENSTNAIVEPVLFNPLTSAVSAFLTVRVASAEAIEPDSSITTVTVVPHCFGSAGFCTCPGATARWALTSSHPSGSTNGPSSPTMYGSQSCGAHGSSGVEVSVASSGASVDAGADESPVESSGAGQSSSGVAASMRDASRTTGSPGTPLVDAPRASVTDSESGVTAKVPAGASAGSQPSVARYSTTMRSPASTPPTVAVSSRAPDPLSVTSVASDSLPSAAYVLSSMASVAATSVNPVPPSENEVSKSVTRVTVDDPAAAAADTSSTSK